MSRMKDEASTDGVREVEGAAWALDLICCGRDDGTQGCRTGAEADEFRESYCNVDGHDRRAIKRRTVDGESLGWHERPDNIPPPPHPPDAKSPCALCAPDGRWRGYGDVVNPGNADPTRAVDEWLPPVLCPRCGGTGWDPLPHAVDTGSVDAAVAPTSPSQEVVDG